MRVLTICTEHPDLIHGGMGNHCANLFEVMAQKKMARVTYLTQHGKPDIQKNHNYELVSSEGPFYGPRETDMEIFLENTARMTIAAGCILAKAQKEKKPFDLVHLHDFPTVQTGVDVQRMFQVPVVHTWHLFQHQVAQVEKHLDQNNVKISQMHEIAGLLNANMNIFCSQSMKSYAHDKMNIPPTNDVVIPNGVPFKEFSMLQHPAARRSFADLRAKFPPKPLVLFSGRLAEQKGYTEILDAIEMTDQFCFIIMGHFNHDDEAFMKHHPNLKRTYKLLKKYPDRIHLTGFKSGHARLPYYSICDVGLMPSKAEPDGITMREFLATGVPTVSTCIDGMAEYANEENCIKIPAKVSGKSIVRGIARALAMAPEEREALKEKAQASAKQMDWEAIARKTVGVYKKILKG